MPAPTDSIEISALTAGAALDGTEIVPLVQSGATVRSTLSAALTYFNANASLDAARITGGTLAVARGGTNIGSYAVGDLLYASGATTLAKLAGVATGNALISGGVATAPAWGKIGLTTHVSGILPLANGGTGADLSATGGANQVLQQTSAGGVVTVGTLDAGAIGAGTLVASRGGTGVSNADANTLTLGGATSITGGGTLALAGFTLTVPATGTAALLATANIFTNTQTIRDSNNALGITLAGANTGGTPAIATSAPTQVAGASAGTPLSITASNAVAGASVAGAAAGGSITITAGNAARLTSGNANGGNISLVTGTGIGTGTAGQVLFPSGTEALPSISFTADPDTGIWRQGNNVLSFSSGGSLIGIISSNTNSLQLGSARVLGFTPTTDPSAVASDTALARNAANVMEVNNGTAGQWGSLKVGTRDAGTTTITDGLTLGHQSTGTPAAGFGAAIQINLNSSTTADQNAAQIAASWTTATHASRTSKLDFSVVQAAGALTSRMTINDGAQAVVYIPWITGDTLTTLRVGSGAANQVAITANTSSATCISGTSGSSIGVHGISSSSNGVRGQAAGSSAATFGINTSSGPAIGGQINTALTNATQVICSLYHFSSGTPAAGFGVASEIQLNSSTSTARVASDVATTWATATDASRKARVVHNVYDTAAREAFRIEASGSASMIGFLGANAAARQTSGADLTNNVTSGGTDDTIANFTDLTIYANDSAAIRNDIYQLARKMKQVNDALRLYGLLT